MVTWEVFEDFARKVYDRFYRPDMDSPLRSRDEEKNEWRGLEYEASLYGRSSSVEK